MAHEDMRRFLELVQRDLGARDARAEIGGADPPGDLAVFAALEEDVRIVALYDEPPDDREALQARLDALVQTFAGTVEEMAPRGQVARSQLARRRLDAELEVLRSRAGALRVVVIDVDSPVLWGSSAPQRQAADVQHLVDTGLALASALRAGVDIDGILAEADANLRDHLERLGVNTEQAGLLGRAKLVGDADAVRAHLVTALAVADARQAAGEPPIPTRLVSHRGPAAYLARSFANIYLLLVIFAEPFSELHAESAIVHALPTVEQLLFALPPVDPPPKGARVLRFPK